MNIYFLFLIGCLIFSYESLAMEFARKIKSNIEKKIQNTVSRSIQPKIEAKKEVTDENKCAICLDGDTSKIDQNFNIVSLNCHKNHKFCTECIVESLKNKSECPLCRGSVAAGTKMKIEMYNILNLNPSITQRDVLLAIGVAELRTNKYADEERLFLESKLRKLTYEYDSLKAIKNSYETEYAALKIKYESLETEKKILEEKRNGYSGTLLLGSALAAFTVGYYVAKKNIEFN